MNVNHSPVIITQSNGPFPFLECCLSSTTPISNELNFTILNFAESLFGPCFHDEFLWGKGCKLNLVETPTDKENYYRVID